KTRVPPSAPPEDERIIDGSQADADHAHTIERGERGGFGQRRGDWLRGESSAPRAAAPVGPVAEDDFSDLSDEPPEDRAKTQTRARVLIGETPGRKVTEGPNGELIVEIEAELPDEYPGPISLEFQVDLGSLDAQEMGSQLEAEPPTLSRRRSGADTPTI